jgi:hypothetical protein
MRKAIKIFVLTLLILVIASVVLLVDLSPSAQANSPEQVDNAEAVQPLIDELRVSLRSRYEAQQINVSDIQAKSLAGFISRAINQANAQVAFANNKMIVTLTYKIETGLFPVYINVENVVLAGKGLKLDSVKVGDLRLPGEFALSKAEYLVNIYTSSAVATKAIESVSSLAVNSAGVQISLAPLDGLLREFKNIETGGSNKDTRLLKIRIAHYLRLLDGLYVPTTSNNTVAPSLSYYMQAAMQEAIVLSQQRSATLENEAVILALAIFAGSPRFTALIGDLSFAIDKLPSAPVKPMLLDRKDLSLHFIFSAAIKLLSQKGISIAVGEFKELMDRGKGGSGYSFVDLAADLAGSHFAELAVDPLRAQNLQKIIASTANESLFMVSISDLDEGLSKAEFADQYGMVDSLAYKKVVTEINRRINALPISQ